MESAAVQIYNEYVRQNAYLVFFAGLVLVTIACRRRWSSYTRAQSLPRYEANGLPSWIYMKDALRAIFSLFWPYALWFLVFGIPMTIADILWGPR
jgi:hypothetical protein